MSGRTRRWWVPNVYPDWYLREQAAVIARTVLPSDAEIHEQGDDGNGERSPGDGLGTDSGQDDDGAAEKDKRQS